MARSALESSLVQAIYDAIVEPGGWERMLRSLGEAIGCESLTLAFVDEGAGAPRVVTEGVEPAFVNVGPRLFLQDTDLARHLAASRVGDVTVSHEFRSDLEWQRASLYNEYFRPQGLHRGAYAFIDRTPSTACFIGLARSSPGFGDEARSLLARLTPHLRQAFRIQRRLARAEHRADAAEQTLDALGLGMVMVDAGGLVLDANDAGQQILEEGTGLNTTRGRLHASRPYERRELDRLVHDAAQAGLGQGDEEPGGELAISREGRRRPLLVTVGPVGRDTAYRWPAGHGAAVVVVRDPERDPELPERRLMRLFGLTPSEARLARLLALGESLESAAELLGVAKETARKRLHALFQKLDVHRQSDLVRLLLRGPGLLPELS